MPRKKKKRKKSASKWAGTLDNIRYRLDNDTLRILNIQIPTKNVYRYEGHGYAPVGLIVEMAEKYHVEPELLIDEHFYIERDGIALYRVALAAVRQFGSLDAFYEYYSSMHDIVAKKQSLFKLLRGEKFYILNARMQVFYDLCSDVGIPFSYIFSPYKIRGYTQTFTTISNVFQGLSNVDIITLIGFAKLISNRKTEDIDIDAIKALLDWRGEHNGEQDSINNSTN